MTSWYGILLPARTPNAIVAKLHDTVVQALKAPDVVEQLRRQGLDAIGSTPEAFGAHIKRELAKWDKVVREAGIKAE